MTANGARGEVSARLAGAERKLCLTLGALAEIEAALEATGFQALADRLRALTAADLVAVLAALIRGGGAEAAMARRLAEMTEPRAAAEAVARAFEAASG